MLKTLLSLFAMVVLFAVAGSTESYAAVCTEGQEMVRKGNVPACTCRPPMQFAPGNLCVSANPKPKTSSDTSIGAKSPTCKPGQNTASGCRCEAPLQVIAAGKCGVPPKVCVEGQSLSTGCKCNSPLMKSTRGGCIRCLPGDGDTVVGGKCKQKIKKR
ncbi:MAG: hypothetical protein ABL901_14345 [Hyphomicrobiaceae bacterium]